MVAFSVKINRAEFDNLFNEVVDVCEEAIRPAAQAGAQVFYDQVKRNVERIGVKSGNLKRSIYQAHSKDNSGPGVETYHVSWNAKKAPHGGLLEYGHLQRYQVYINSKGQWKTKVRPEMQGKPKPGRGASQATKDAYYMPRTGGPVQWLGKAFIRGAYESHAEKAMDAMSDRYFEEFAKRYGA